MEEANPASMLVSTSPARVPSRRTAKWPQNEMPAITTTINQILKGLKASRGPISSLGSTGSSTSEMSRKRRVAWNSVSLRNSIPCWICPFKPINRAASTAQATASLGLSSTDISPSR